MLSLALPREARLKVGWKKTRAGEPEREWVAIPECSIMTAAVSHQFLCSSYNLNDIRCGENQVFNVYMSVCFQTDHVQYHESILLSVFSLNLHRVLNTVSMTMFTYSQ